MTTFGATLRAIMERRGLKQARVVEQTDIDHAYLSRLLNGQRQPSRDIVDRIVAGSRFTAEESRRLYVAAGFVPVGDDALLLDPGLREAVAALNDPTIPLPYRDSLRRQISALVGITRQMAA